MGRSAVPVPPATSIIGREAELLYARTLLRRHDVRLLTLTGTGGVGKTRLAIEIARQVASSYPDGVFFIPIASITDPSLVLPEIMATLGLRSAATPQSVGEDLGEREILLVIDNFEQVVDAAPVVAELLNSAPGIQIMVTSRVLLRTSGEHQLQVVPLALPILSRLPPFPELASIPALELFSSRAKAATGSFELTEANAADVALVCSRLDGLPLAIELAAARLRHLTLAALTFRLDRRLELLIDGPRDVPARLRTLRDAIAWSYSLLPSKEQAFLRQMSVFSGSFTLEAAQEVSNQHPLAETLACVSALIDNNLLVRLEHESSTPRFSMLETIREFAQEQLAASSEEEQIRQRHSIFFQKLADEANAAVEGPEHGVWMLRLRADQDNFRTAIRNALDRQLGEIALKLSMDLWSYWSSSEYVSEGRHWLEQSVTMALDAPAPLRGHALANLGNLALTQFDLHAAQRHYLEALSIWKECGTVDNIAVCELGLAGVSRYLGQYQISRQYYDQVLETWSIAGDLPGVAIAEHALGAMLAEAGDFSDSRNHHRLAMDHRRQVGEPFGLAYTLVSFATLERWDGNAVNALMAASEALAIFQELQSNDGILLAYLQLARLAADAGNDAEALDLLRKSFVLLQMHMRAKAAIEAWETLAAILARRKLALPAAVLLSAATAHRQTRSLVVPIPDRSAVADTRAAIANMLGVTAFSTAWSEGQRLSLEQGVTSALLAIDDPAQAAAGGPAYDLTRRELEVLSLLAAHLSDREIADRLFLSPRTIERHVSNILLKMEAPNRRLAAARAVREQLVATNQ